MIPEAHYVCEHGLSPNFCDRCAALSLTAQLTEARSPLAMENRIRDLESALRLWLGHADTLVEWTEEELQRMPSVKKYLDDVAVARKLLEVKP